MIQKNENDRWMEQRRSVHLFLYSKRIKITKIMTICLKNNQKNNIIYIFVDNVKKISLNEYNRGYIKRKGNE